MTSSKAYIAELLFHVLRILFSLSLFELKHKHYNGKIFKNAMLLQSQKGLILNVLLCLIYFFYQING